MAAALEPAADASPRPWRARGAGNSPVTGRAPRIVSAAVRSASSETSMAASVASALRGGEAGRFAAGGSVAFTSSASFLMRPWISSTSASRR